MKDVTKQVEYGSNNTFESIQNDINSKKIELSKLNDAFKNNPCNKTAKPLPILRNEILFLEESLEYTEKAKSLKIEKSKNTIIQIAKIVAPQHKVIFN